MSALLGVLIAGNIALQVPLGLAAERWSARRRAGRLRRSLPRSAAFLIPLLIETPLIWPLIFVWGAALLRHLHAGAGRASARASPASMLVAGNAAFALMWGIGGIAGPSATGVVMDAVGVRRAAADARGLTVGAAGRRSECCAAEALASGAASHLLGRPETWKELRR